MCCRQPSPAQQKSRSMRFGFFFHRMVERKAQYANRSMGLNWGRAELCGLGGRSGEQYVSSLIEMRCRSWGAWSPGALRGRKWVPHWWAAGRAGVRPQGRRGVQPMRRRCSPGARGVRLPPRAAVPASCVPGRTNWKGSWAFRQNIKLAGSVPMRPGCCIAAWRSLHHTNCVDRRTMTVESDDLWTTAVRTCCNLDCSYHP
jgi:hypothetical protein